MLEVEIIFERVIKIPVTEQVLSLLHFSDLTVNLQPLNHKKTLANSGSKVNINNI